MLCLLLYWYTAMAFFVFLTLYKGEKIEFFPRVCIAVLWPVALAAAIAIMLIAGEMKDWN